MNKLLLQARQLSNHKNPARAACQVIMKDFFPHSDAYIKLLCDKILSINATKNINITNSLGLAVLGQWEASLYFFEPSSQYFDFSTKQSN
jgi:hypothetical protein